MKSLRAVAVASALLAATIAIPMPDAARAATGNIATADASGGGGGLLGGTPPSLGVGLIVSTPGTSGAGHQTYRADDPKAPRPVFERAIPADNGDGITNLCNNPDGPPGPLGNGWWFSLELFATFDGRYLATVGVECVLFDPAAPGVPPAAPEVPQPPTVGEIWRAIGLATPPIGTSPAVRGVTGLPTWVWTNGAAPVAVAVGLAGYTITGSARVVGYGAYSGEDGWVRSRTAGDLRNPAAAHVYERTGTYRLGVATLWTATAVMTGPGLAAPLTIELGTAIVTNARDYPVVSIRSRLLP